MSWFHPTMSFGPIWDLLIKVGPNIIFDDFNLCLLIGLSFVDNEVGVRINLVKPQ